MNILKKIFNITPPILKPIKYTNSIEQIKSIKSGRYLVIRKDGKMHFEQFNGTGWAYNNNVIEWYYIETKDKN
jgi:hypothetical protein